MQINDNLLTGHFLKADACIGKIYKNTLNAPMANKAVTARSSSRKGISLAEIACLISLFEPVHSFFRSTMCK